MVLRWAVKNMRLGRKIWLILIKSLLLKCSLRRWRICRTTCKRNFLRGWKGKSLQRKRYESINNMNCGKYQIYNQFEQQNCRIWKQAKAKLSKVKLCYHLLFYFLDTKVRKGQTSLMKVRKGQKMRCFIICKSAWNAAIAMLCATLPQKSAKIK